MAQPRLMAPHAATARYLAIPRNRRPPGWEICIPYSWWSDTQRAEIQRERQDKGLPELTLRSRPDLAAAPPKKRRADKGKPNPKRGRKQASKDAGDQRGDDWGVSVPPQPDDAGVSTRQPQGCLQDSPRGVSETPNLPVVTLLADPPPPTREDAPQAAAAEPQEEEEERLAASKDQGQAAGEPPAAAAEEARAVLDQGRPAVERAQGADRRRAVQAGAADRTGPR